MRLKRRVLSFLWKLLRDEISFRPHGSAFQAHGPATEKALSVTWSWVCVAMKLPHTLDRRRVLSRCQTSSNRYCGATISYQFTIF